MRTRTLLIDGDILVYQAAADFSIWSAGDFLFLLKGEAQQKVPDEEPKNIGKLTPSKTYVKMKLEASINLIKRRLDSSDIAIYLTEEKEATNFRKKLCKTIDYKGNRKDLKKPILYDYVREILIEEYGAIVSKGEEADDMIGIRHFKGFLSGKNNTVYVSRDKDRLTIPGWSYDPYKDKFEYIKELEAERNFYEQVLQGDKADNIPGLKGIGPIKAKKILKTAVNAQELFARVRNAYKERYGEDEYKDRLTETASLLRIRRHEGELWSPPIYMEL